jgi:hypothetical protein
MHNGDPAFFRDCRQARDQSSRHGYTASCQQACGTYSFIACQRACKVACEVARKVQEFAASNLVRNPERLIGI